MRGCLEAAEGRAVELSRLRRVLVEKDGEAWDAARAVRGAREESDQARGELESERAVAGVELGAVRGELALVRGELESVRKEVVVVASVRDAARKEAAHWSMRVDKFVEGRKICDKEHERLLQEGCDLRTEIERLKSGKILRGKDKGTRMLALPPPVVMVGVGVQAVMPGVSTVSVQTDVSHMQVVRKATYASVASQACPEVALAGGGVDVKMGGMGGGPSGPHSVPPVPAVPTVPVPGVVRAQALLIHGVDCRRAVGALLVAACRLRVGECTVHGVRWLLGVGRRWGKRLSSVVVYLDRPVVVRGNSVWFGGALHPVERYIFGR